MKESAEKGRKGGKRTRIKRGLKKKRDSLSRSERGEKWRKNKEK